MTNTNKLARAADDTNTPQDSPLVFISYSYDSRDHRAWVLEFAQKLVKNGVQVILDVWDLGLGDDLAKFMEASIQRAHRVLAICSETYVHKADEGKGGVGYEHMIVTSQLIRDIGTNKFIPIFRQQRGGHLTPKALSTRLGVDLSDDTDTEAEFKKLLAQLHNASQINKPQLGPNPFANLPAGASAGLENTDSALAEVGRALSKVASAPNAASSESAVNLATSDVYGRALELARTGNASVWRRFVRNVTSDVHSKIVDWRLRQEMDKGRGQWLPTQLAEEAATIYAPLFATALAGVDSSDERFRHQVGVLYDIVRPSDWIPSGFTSMVNLPKAMGYLFQGLHGALCVDTDQLKLAIELATSSMPNRDGENEPLYLHPDLIGWPESISERSDEAWKYLLGVPRTWPWLSEPFGPNIQTFQASLYAYYLALSILELTVDIAKGNTAGLVNENARGLMFNVPLHLSSISSETRTRAYALLIRQRDAVADIWRSRKVSDVDMVRFWTVWHKFHIASAGRMVFSLRMEPAFGSLISDISG